ncbi:cation:proton antiporter [Desulforhopalus singaporensis]|uniref:Sodium/proton antiporter, CPA1 family n=1 Tax=Desulforhopalus singaporensis TaxID=91360 RepID=A0A1H0TZQ6_9BACT|nr:sodium:proton antiporter [Desulforhopalus singaporensis]SDP59423.1 sodium/proton antiporter, CPA1 family [Desulforhopalus singaporensis]
MSYQEILSVIAGSFAVCILCQWIAWWMKLPAIIFLLAAGIFAGPVSGLFNPETLLGDLFTPFVSLSVAIILFEGSLTLRFRDIMGLQKVVRNMLSFGLAVTWLISAAAAHFALDVSWEIAFLFGAITVVTGPTVIAPLLRTVRPVAKVANILRWEGIVIDSVGASLAVVVYEFIISGGGREAWGHTFAAFAGIIGVGGASGAVGGYLFGLMLRNHLIPEFLQNVATLGLVFICFVTANSFQPESGLVAVTVLGVWLANMKDIDLEAILEFKESLSVLLISLLFLMLAARLDFTAFSAIGWEALFVFVAVQFVARPVNVILSSIGSQLSWPERHLLAWIAPRGIVAAAIASLFAIRLEAAGFDDVGYLVPLTFVVIIGTVSLQSVTSRPIARWLGVALPEPRGFLIVGANLVAREIGKVLQDNGFPVQLVDPDRQKVMKARGEGLKSFSGHPVSVYFDRHMNFSGTGKMLGLAPNESENTAAVMHYRLEFGKNNVYALDTGKNKGRKDNNSMTQRRGQILFGTEVSYKELASCLESQGQIRTTGLSDRFSYDEYLALHQDNAIVLFFIDTRDRIRIVTHHNKIKPEPGWKVIALIRNKADRTDGSSA